MLESSGGMIFTEKGCAGCKYQLDAGYSPKMQAGKSNEKLIGIACSKQRLHICSISTATSDAVVQHQKKLQWLHLSPLTALGQLIWDLR